MEFASQVSGIFTAHPTPDLRVRVESGSPGSHVFVGSAIKNYHLGMVLLQAMYEKNEIVEDFWRCVELCCCFIDEFWLIVVMVLFFWNHVDGRVAIPHLWLDIKLDEHWKSPDST